MDVITDAVHLCVDMQRLFDRDGPWETPWMSRVLPIVGRLAEAHPEKTVFTRFVPPETPRQARGRWRDFYEHWRDVTLERLDPKLIDLVDPLAALVPPATVIDKPAYSPFERSRLQAVLQERGATTLIISGAETDVCVLAAVLDAVDLGYRVVIARDALCSANDATHDALLTLYEQRYSHQIDLASSAEILELWR